MRGAATEPVLGLAENFLKASRARSGRPLLLGILNVTPDSFYDQSRFPEAEAAIERGLKLAEEGADALDIGGQSTKPGSEPISLEEEIRRVLPVVSALALRLKIPISIDTDKAEVARRCREAGASILNDVSALRNDPGMASEAQNFKAVILMHRGGESSKTMQNDPRYSDVVEDVYKFLAKQRDLFVAAGGEASRLLYDPGIGFGKTLEHNLSLLKHVERYHVLGPVVVGASRKSFIGRLNANASSDAGPQDRLAGSLACAVWAALCWAAVIRVHDVAETRRALDVLCAVRDAS
jgi:dihydropteroate synthase